MTRIDFTEAAALNIEAATDEQLMGAWHAYARQISFHHADDSGREWGSARNLMPRARDIEGEIRRRGLPRPTGEYLMGDNDRIDWETGEWSRGWAHKKRAALGGAQ